MHHGNHYGDMFLKRENLDRAREFVMRHTRMHRHATAGDATGIEIVENLASLTTSSRLNTMFENDPESREGIVFRESRAIARALGLKPVTPGAFLELDSEQLRYAITGDKLEIQVGVYSSVTGERVSSVTIIPPQGNWQVEQTIRGFPNETEGFIESYFGRSNTIRERVADFDEVLEEIGFMLNRIKKRLPLRR